MIPLTEGALSQIMQGVRLEGPVLQYLGHKKLASSNSGERYRLLVNDGTEVNSYTMLATQLNNLITDQVLTEFSICRVNKFAISLVNNSGQQRRVMVILSIEVLVPGSEIGKQIGNAHNPESGKPEETAAVKRADFPTPAPYVPQLNSSLSGMSGGSITTTTPIAGLTPFQNKWIIKARVMSKSDKRSWNNSKGEGTLFSMDLVDESGEIRCTAFRQQCEKYFDMIEVGKVYYISRCALKAANKQFSNLKNDYEMTLNNDSEIVSCTEDVEDIPTLQFDFRPISEIENKEKNDLVDILGIVKSVGDVATLTAKSSGRELKKRDVNIIDESNVMVTLTLWGQQAETFTGENSPVIALKAVRVGEFQGGKSLQTISSSVMQIDPDIPEAHKLRGWYSKIGASQESKFISKSMGAGGGMSGPWLTFKDVKEMRLGQPNEPNTYICKATINMIKSDNCLYKSCPTENCKKKVVDQSNGMYRCEKCDREFPNFAYRILAPLSLSDWSGNQWATAFSEEAEKLLDVSAAELGEMKETDNSMFLEKIRESALKTYMFKLRVRLENFNDEWRLKSTVASVQPLNYKTYNDHLLKKIRELANIGKA